MHDIYSATANSLNIIIPELQSKGYTFVTVSELFYYKEIDKLIVTNKYKKKEENLREWLLEVRCEEAWGIEPERWEHFLTVINQMAFGNKEPYATEVEKVSKLYHELHINTYKNASKIKRLFYKYIKVL